MRIAAIFFAIVALLGIVVTILLLDPTSGGITPYLALYAGIFLFSSSIFAAIFAKRAKMADAGSRHTVLRQAALLGILSCGLIALQQFRLLTPVSGMLLVVGVCIVEFGFLVFGMRQDHSA